MSPPFASTKTPAVLVRCIVCSLESVFRGGTIEEAKRGIRLDGWRRVLLGEEWKHFCPRCK